MTQLRSPIIWRLILWFLLLSLIPFGVVLVFVQREVSSVYLDAQINTAKDRARLLSQLIAAQPKKEDETIINNAREENAVIFLLNLDGSYLIHSDPRLNGKPAALDLGQESVDKLLLEQTTGFEDSAGQRIFSSYKDPQNSFLVVMIFESATIRVPLTRLSGSIVLQLSISLLIASVAGGVGILTVLNPLVHLAGIADQITSGDQIVEFETDEYEGELLVLANRLKTLAVNVRNAISTLEQRVNERTEALVQANDYTKKRALQFQAVTEVTRAMNTASRLQILLPQISEVISEKFGYYHVGIFLNDDSGQYAILSSANSEGGKLMLNRRHQLKIGEQGIVGYVTSAGKPRIALDVGEDAAYFNNPDLPLTRSEMALPLILGDKIVGALDIQSAEQNAFNADDIEVLTILAEQVSLAIQNARLFDQNEKTLSEADAIQRQYLRNTWTQLSKDENLKGFRYSITGSEPLEDDSQLENPENRQEVAVPIVLRGEQIGTLSIQVPKDERIGADQLDLINAVAERVALSAENARLFEDTTRRAERERVISDISAKIGTSVRTENILRTAAKELSQLLEDADILIKLQPPETP